ncbi:MAG: hypothetical protein H6713_37315 [Myxococcales bacterium]|nr:hypothetical protein [Myxococcales bacterium]
MLDLRLPADAATLTLATVAAISDQPTHPRVRDYLDVVARELGATPPAPDVAAPDPEALAAAVNDDDAREATLQRLLIAAMLVPPLTGERVAQLERYAAALGRAREPALLDLRRLVRGRKRALTMGLMGRFPPLDRMKRAWRGGSWGARWRMMKAFARLADGRTAARYVALGELPDETLGRRFFEHCRAHDFPLPGERRGLPEPGVFHDMGHALLGHDTDIIGETRMAGFEAGTMGPQGFVMLEFTLLLFNLGAPLPTDAEPQVDKVDIPSLFDAFARGRASSLDVLRWDPWEDVETPVAELRARYQIA